MFTLVWFIILVAVLNKVLNTLHCTQYHVCQTTLKRKKNSKKDKKLLVQHSKKQVCKNEGKTNQNELIMFDMWMPWKSFEHSSLFDFVIISESFNERNLTLLEEEQWQEIGHLVNPLIASKEFPLLFMNKYQQLIKKAQHHCQITAEVECDSEAKDVSRYVSLYDDNFVTCLPYGGRKMETSPPFMPKDSALEPVTMTTTGS